jgi:hypothetical protein
MALINKGFVFVVDAHRHRPDWQNYRIYGATLPGHSENRAYDSAEPQNRQPQAFLDQQYGIE